MFRFDVNKFEYKVEKFLLEKFEGILDSDELLLVINHHVGDTFIFLLLVKIMEEKFGKKVVPILKSSTLPLIRYFPQIKKFFLIDDDSEMKKMIQEISQISWNYPEVFNIYDGKKRVWFAKAVFQEFSPYVVNTHLDSFAYNLGLSEADNYYERYSKPSVEEAETKRAHQYMKTFNFLPNKSLILFPFSSSLNLWTARYENIELFKTVADKAVELGMRVYTNVDPSTEHLISNTSPIFPALDTIITICDFSGYVIGFRNGLLDIAVHSKAKLLVFYPDIVHYVGKRYIDHFSLVRMYRKTNVVEMIWDKILTEKGLEEILSEVETFLKT